MMKPLIIVHIDGGIVQQIVSDQPVDATVVVMHDKHAEESWHIHSEEIQVVSRDFSLMKILSAPDSGFVSLVRGVEPDFRAVFNPFNRQLAVKYGTSTMDIVFDVLDEWATVYFSDDETENRFLHIHLDYDEELGLLFYPRTKGEDDLNEDLGTFYNSSAQIDTWSHRLRLAYTNAEFDRQCAEFLNI